MNDERINIIREGGIEYCLDQINNHDYHIRYRAVEVLGELGKENVLPILLQLAGEQDTNDEESRVNFAAGLAVIELVNRGFVTMEEVSSKLMTLDEDDPRSEWKRYYVGQGLKGLDVTNSTEILIGLLTDPCEDLVDGAVSTLVSRRKVEALPAILELSGKEPHEYQYAIDELSRIKRAWDRNREKIRLRNQEKNNGTQ